MTKEQAVKDLREIAQRINDYADQLIIDFDNVKDFSILIRLNIDGSEASTYQVEAEYGV